ncbi:MAG: sigma-70 family RNA polymerase sigma factor [Armatimonadetes bacterium]|nr:sigma-70 family RNA polymerase sigma factor [Armatimonadota bacterium]
MSPTDEYLVERCREGDLGAYALLVDRYRARIFNLILRLVGNREDAEDLAQEVFVRAYQGLHTFDATQRFSPWLYRVATNHCASALRRKRLPTVPLIIGEGEDAYELPLPDLSAEPERHWLRREERQEIHDAILALPERYRVAILLYHMEELSYEGIAVVMQVPLNTVRTFLHRGRALLRQALEGVAAP